MSAVIFCKCCICVSCSCFLSFLPTLHPTGLKWHFLGALGGLNCLTIVFYKRLFLCSYILSGCRSPPNKTRSLCSLKPLTLFCYLHFSSLYHFLSFLFSFFWHLHKIKSAICLSVGFSLWEQIPSTILLWYTVDKIQCASSCFIFLSKIMFLAMYLLNCATKKYRSTSYEFSFS